MAEETPTRRCTRSSTRSSRNPELATHASSSEEPKPITYAFKIPAPILYPDAEKRRLVEKYQRVDKGFVVTMKETFVSGDSRLCVPYDHANKYLKEYKDKRIWIVAGDRGWKVHVRCSRDKYRFGKGWRDFVTNNQIGLNDVCVFKLKDGHYRVLIFTPVPETHTPKLCISETQWIICIRASAVVVFYQ